MGLQDQAADERRSTDAHPNDSRRTSLVSLAVFDIGGPLAVYYALRSSGISAVVALVISGLLPAIGIGLGVRRHRRVDAVGVVVLMGILIGTVVGLASGSARLVLLDGTVPTAALALVCFGSLLTQKPLMFRVALQFMGPESGQGREFREQLAVRGVSSCLRGHYRGVGSRIPHRNNRPGCDHRTCLNQHRQNHVQCRSLHRRGHHVCVDLSVRPEAASTPPGRGGVKRRTVQLGEPYGVAIDRFELLEHRVEIERHAPAAPTVGRLRGSEPYRISRSTGVPGAAPAPPGQVSFQLLRRSSS